METPSRPSNAGRAEFGITDIGSEPVKGAPKLGKKPGGGAWLAKSRAYWEVWRRMPVASQFQETDWQALERATWIQDEVWRRDAPIGALAEVRQIEAKLGATIADRMQLRLRVGSKTPAEPAAEVEGDGRRRARPRKGDPRRLHAVDEEASA